MKCLVGNEREARKAHPVNDRHRQKSPKRVALLHGERCPRESTGNEDDVHDEPKEPRAGWLEDLAREG
jgi:hypothetical protein